MSIPDATPAAVATPATPIIGAGRPTRRRHAVLWLTVAAYLITYMDRVVIASAVPHIREEFALDLVTTGWILSSFRWGYAVFQIPSAWLGDRFGPRRALALIVTWWSAFTALTTAAWSASSMIAVRFLFGVGEAGAFPIATRSLSRWMLPSERGWAQGLTHAGSRLGAALTPPLVVVLIGFGGWRLPFLAFAGLGVGWAALWFWYYRDTPGEHAGVNPAERTLIQSALGTPTARSTQPIPWRRLFASPMLWKLSFAYTCYAYCIVVYLDWFPTYLREHRGFTLKEMGFYAMLPLLCGTFGDLVGGWVSDYWLKRTGNLTQSRRLVAIGGFAIAALGIIPAALTANAVACIVYTCLGVFGLELTVGVCWAVTLDIGGDFAGSTSAIMNTCGNLGGALSTTILALLVRSYGWESPFLVASFLCLVAAVLFLKIDAAARLFPKAA